MISQFVRRPSHAAARRSRQSQDESDTRRRSSQTSAFSGAQADRGFSLVEETDRAVSAQEQAMLDSLALDPIAMLVTVVEEYVLKLSKDIHAQQTLALRSQPNVLDAFAALQPPGLCFPTTLHCRLSDRHTTN